MSKTMAKKNAPVSPTVPAPLTVLETIKLRPDELDTNATHKGRLAPVPDDIVTGLALSLTNYGQLQPVQAYRLEDGTPRLIFGFTRHTAAQKVVSGFRVRKDGVQTDTDDSFISYPPNPDFALRVEIVEKPSDDDILVRTLSENAQRKNPNRMDDAVNQQLLRDTGMTDVAIARIYGYAHSASVMRIRELLKLSKPWQDKVADGSVTMVAANIITNWSVDHDAQNRLLEALKIADPVAYDSLGQKGAEWLIQTHGADAFAPPDGSKPAGQPGPGGTAAGSGVAAATKDTAEEPTGAGAEVKARAATAKEIKEAITSAVDPVMFAGCDEITAGIVLKTLNAIKEFAEGKVVVLAFMDTLKGIAAKA